MSGGDWWFREFKLIICYIVYRCRRCFLILLLKIISKLVEFRLFVCGIWFGFYLCFLMRMIFIDELYVLGFKSWFSIVFLNIDYILIILKIYENLKN